MTAVCQEHGSEVRPSWLPNRELSYVSQGEAILHRAVGMRQKQDGWQTENNQGEQELMLSTVLPTLGKVSRLETVLDVTVVQLHYALFEQLEQMPGKATAEDKLEAVEDLPPSQLLQRIGKNTLLTHKVTTQSLGNFIGQRDLVRISHFWTSETTVYLFGTSIRSEFMDVQMGQLRAESGVSCIVLQLLEGDLNHSHFTWLLSMDLKFDGTTDIKKSYPDWQKKHGFQSCLRRLANSIKTQANTVEAMLASCVGAKDEAKVKTGPDNMASDG